MTIHIFSLYFTISYHQSAKVASFFLKILILKACKSFIMCGNVTALSFMIVDVLFRILDDQRCGGCHNLDCKMEIN